MELRAAMRTRPGGRGPKRRAGGARAAHKDDDSEDEGGVSLAAIKNKYKQGQKGKSPLQILGAILKPQAFFGVNRIIIIISRKTFTNEHRE